MNDSESNEYGFGEMFHTALRKGSDTKWSVMLWNLLNMIQSADGDDKKAARAWSHFVGYCHPMWNQGNGPKPSECAKAWAKADDAGEFYPSLDQTGRSVLLRTSIELCDQQTWDDIDGSIEFWVKS